MLPNAVALGCAVLWHVVVTRLFLNIVELRVRNAWTLADRLAVSQRLVSLAHGILSTLAGLLIISNCSDHILNSRCWLTEKFTVWFAVYLLYDTYLAAKVFRLKNTAGDGGTTRRFPLSSFIRSDPVILFHHLVLPCLFLPVILAYRRGLGDYFVGCFMLFESVIPFSNLREILIQIKWKGKLYYINGVLLIIVFLCCRLAIFPFLYMQMAAHAGVPLTSVPARIPTTCNLGCLLLLCMNTYFFGIIVRTAYRELALLVQDKYYNGNGDTASSNSDILQRHKVNKDH